MIITTATYRETQNKDYYDHYLLEHCELGLVIKHVVKEEFLGCGLDRLRWLRGELWRPP